MVQITINKQLVTLRGGTWSGADKDLAAGLAGIFIREGATELEHAIDVAKATGGTIVLIDEPSCHQVIKPAVIPAAKAFENALSDFQPSQAKEGEQPQSAPPPTAPTRPHRSKR